MRKLALYFLGPPRIEYNGTAVKLTTRKAVALLAYLALTQNTQRRETLLALLWPELNRRRGLAALRTTLSAVRKAFNGEWVRADGDTIGLAAGYWPRRCACFVRRLTGKMRRQRLPMPVNGWCWIRCTNRRSAV